MGESRIMSEAQQGGVSTGKELGADGGVRPDHRPLIRIERRGFQEDSIRNRDFANIVQWARSLKEFALRCAKPGCPPKRRRVMASCAWRGCRWRGLGMSAGE